MITPKNLVRHELIGLGVKVGRSTNASLAGTSGKVVDETKRMLAVKTQKGVKKVAKRSAEFIFTLPDRTKVRVDGRIIEKRPEDRIKIRIRKW
ncbi:MAG: ribonuclease P protein component 1 [Candidatus Aenigmatarchaeota archaeon]